MRKSEEMRLKVFERKIIKIYGVCVDNHTGICRKIHNKELKELFQRSNIIEDFSKEWMVQNMQGGNRNRGHY